jgi:excisionase family DNA binding protein
MKQFQPDLTPIERLLYSLDEAAVLLSMSRRTIERDCRLGRIQSKRYGRRVLIPASEIHRLATEGMKLLVAR